MASYLLHVPSGDVYPHHELFAKDKDFAPCDRYGAQLKPAPPPPPPSPEPVRKPAPSTLDGLFEHRVAPSLDADVEPEVAADVLTPRGVLPAVTEADLAAVEESILSGLK